MAQSNYQEPIEQKDLDLGKKLKEVKIDSEKFVAESVEKKEVIATPEVATEAKTGTGAEVAQEKESEMIETARKTISTQQAQPTPNIEKDAKKIADIQEYEKKVDKLIEMAVQMGPEHAIRVAQHMDKNQPLAQADNYTLDEIHGRMMEEELRAELIRKGLLTDL